MARTASFANDAIPSSPHPTWLDRILDYLAQYQVENPVARIREIIETFNVLEH